MRRLRDEHRRMSATGGATGSASGPHSGPRSRGLLASGTALRWWGLSYVAEVSCEPTMPEARIGQALCDRLASEFGGTVRLTTP